MRRCADDTEDTAGDTVESPVTFELAADGVHQAFGSAETLTITVE